MGISNLSFYQQDQNWYIQQQNWTTQLSAGSGLTSAITSALQNQATGLAGIANQAAIQRVDTQITSTLQGALGSTSSSASSSSISSPSASSSTSSSSASSTGAASSPSSGTSSTPR